MTSHTSHSLDYKSKWRYAKLLPDTDINSKDNTDNVDLEQFIITFGNMCKYHSCCTVGTIIDRKVCPLYINNECIAVNERCIIPENAKIIKDEVLKIMRKEDDLNEK